MTDKVDPLLDLDSRRRIFRHIERNPGLHLRGLQRSLEIPLGTIEYHLHQMEKGGLIVSRDDGRFKAFFAKDGLDRRDKDILYYVRQEMPRQIVLQLLLSPGMTHGELTGALPISGSTCSFHIKKLVAAEIVVEERVGRSKRFKVRESDRVAGVIVRYRRSFLDDLVDRFARAWLDLGHGTAAGVVDEDPEPEEVETRLLSSPEDMADGPPEDALEGSLAGTDFAPTGPAGTTGPAPGPVDGSDGSRAGLPPLAPYKAPPSAVEFEPAAHETPADDTDGNGEEDERSDLDQTPRPRNGRRPPGGAAEDPGDETEVHDRHSPSKGTRIARLWSLCWRWMTGSRPVDLRWTEQTLSPS